MAQQFREPAALVENLGSVPSTHIRWITITYLQRQVQGIQHPLLASSGRCTHRHILIKLILNTENLLKTCILFVKIFLYEHYLLNN